MTTSYERFGPTTQEKRLRKLIYYACSVMHGFRADRLRDQGAA